MTSVSWTTRAILLAQSLIIFAFEKLLPPDLIFMSAYGTSAVGLSFGVWVIPAILFLASFLPLKHRPVLYVAAAIALVPSLSQAILLVGFSLAVFIVSPFRKKDAWLTGFLLVSSLALIFSANLGYFPLNWFFLLVHVMWGLKLIAWIVSIRFYDRSYTRDEFIDYFFNPAFFFFTNDLNVLTPARFAEARSVQTPAVPQTWKPLGLTVFGLALIAVYGALQKFYFLNLDHVGWAKASWFGGVISVAVAILFHAANIVLQVSFLRPAGYRLPIDMDRPWLATSPSDYWKRMHFYVREYILEIILKPVLVFLARQGFGFRLSRLTSLFALYFVFTCTQIGYQPFRQPRTLEISALVTLVFIAMIGLPELLSDKSRDILFQRHVWIGRALTFLILATGYSLIFGLRQGF